MVPPTRRKARCSVEMITPFWWKTVRFQVLATQFGPGRFVEHLLSFPSQPFQHADCTFVLASFSQMYVITCLRKGESPREVPFHV